MSVLSDPQAAIAWLRRPEAIRQRCQIVYQAAQADRLRHFSLDLGQLDAAADYVLQTIRQNYPSLSIPYHSRWRHFAADGHDYWAGLAANLGHYPPQEIARIRTELAIVSVLLDAGAGERWRYLDKNSGKYYARSEGLALASFAMYTSGAFSASEDNPLRVDADGLMSVGEALLAQAFQVSAENPLVGVNGRTNLLRRLAWVLKNTPQLFGNEGRLGLLFDYFAAESAGKPLSAGTILATVLTAFSTIWPGRIEIDGVNLGDVWRHGIIKTDDLTDGLIPFHKLSQWLSYSLLEPLQEAGIAVADMNCLTGLPEYRNGGLFLDCDVLRPKRRAILDAAHAVDSEVIVEWRALTVCLLDALAQRIRIKLALDETALPLAKVLEGGSWSAGRRIAREKRPDGSPPLRLISDGTVF